MDKNRQRTKASFRISGSELDPMFWIEYFGRTSDSYAVKGGVIVRKDKRAISFPARTGVCIFDQIENGNSLSIDENVSNLLRELKMPRLGLADLLKSKGETCDVFVYVDNWNGDNPPKYSDATKRLVEECGGTLEIDLYETSQAGRRT
jgi:hypothetical protein